MPTIKLRPDAETEWTEIVTLRGATGATGAAGADGEDGADGASAYTQAQAGGYGGSLADFYADLAAIEGLAAELAAI